MATDKIALNQKLADQLGWSPTDFGAIAFDDLLVRMITVQQELLNVPVVDGIAGVQTYNALLALKIAHLVTRPQADLLAARGLIALYSAKQSWLEDITDLPAPTSGDFERCRRWIDDTIRTPLGADWSWEPPYTLNRIEWCGMAAARWWGVAGMKLPIRRSFFPSTYRLDRWARYQPFDDKTPNPRPGAGPYRMMLELDENSKAIDAVFPDGTLPRAGDIVMVGGRNTAYGKHICVAETFDPIAGEFTTIDGNGTGLDPRGTRQHGVIRARRMIGLRPGELPTTYHVRRIIRPAPSDCV